MVFESMLVDILNRYLRPYVKRLDPSQIKVGVWKGHAHLEKLELKEDVFEEADLDIPVQIKNSYIGRLELKIPWKRLTKDPLYVTIDEVYVVVGPKIDTHYDAERDLKRRRKEKEKKIEKFEDAAKKRKKKEKEAKKSRKSKKTDKPDTFTEKLVTNLLKNMEVKVRDVHVRYEDSTSSPHGTLAAGVTLHSLELKSTDENWKPSFVREAATIIFKLLELNCLGLYWNTYTTNMAALPQLQMADEMREAIARPVLAPPPTIEYLLKPMSATARLKLSLRPGTDMDVPQATVDVHVDNIVLTLQETQFKSVLNTVELFDRHVANLKFLKYRPEVGVREGPRAWWRYAISAVKEEQVRRKLEMWSWKHILEHRLTFKQYRDKYREKVKSLSPSSSLLKQIQELEDQLNWFNIVIARREAKKEKTRAIVPVQPKQKKTSSVSEPPTTPVTPSPHTPSPITRARSTHPPTVEVVPSSADIKKRDGKATAVTKRGEKKDEKKKKGFFSNFRKKLKSSGKSEDVRSVAVKSDRGSGEGGKVEGASGGVSTAVEEVVEMEEEREERERREFYKAIGYSEDEEYHEYPKEYVAHKILVNLNTVTVKLSGKKQLATLVTNRVVASVLNRPSSESVSVAASVAGLEMRGIPHPNLDPTIILSTMTSDLSTPLADLRLELNPLASDFDLDIRASLQPLQITYDADTIDGLIAAFRVRENIHLQELTGAASATVEDLRTQSSASFQNALKRKKQMRLDVTLHSPYLVLPQGGYLSPHSSLLVVDLGTLSISGNTRGQLKDQCELKDAGDELSRYYDNFTLKLEGMQVIVANPDDDWQLAMCQGASPLHILNPTGLQLQLKQSIVKKDAYLPSIRIEGDIPGFEVSVSDEKLVTILSIVTTAQLPPPSLANRTSYYDDIPAPTIVRPSSLTGIADDVIDTMSLSSYLEEDEEETCSLSPTSSLAPSTSDVGSELGQDDKTVERIFTDAQIQVVIRKIGVGLTQVVRNADTPRSTIHVTQRKLLDISVEQMRADITDRSWDAHGSVTIGNVSVLDHISLDSNGSPTVLLKTRGLTDGNFITAKFVSVTQVGKAFAEKYTGFKNSVSAQLSLVELRLERRTIAALLGMGLGLKPAMDKAALPAEEVDSVHGGTLSLGVPTTPTPSPVAMTNAINPNDYEDAGQKQPKELCFDAHFEGIEVHVAHEQVDIAYAQISGFLVKGKTEVGSVNITASMEDVLVEDPQSTHNNKIVSRTDSDKSMIELQVTDYKHPPHERNPLNLDWMDTDIKAEIQRLKVQLDIGFLDRILDFAKHLKIKRDALVIAAKATADTATAAATAIRESEKTAHRVKLDIALHAPLILLPFFIKTSRGHITIDLGDFHVQNRFVYGESLLTGPLDTISGKAGKTTFDLMEIRSTAIQIHRSSSRVSSSGLHGDEMESSSIILEPLQFTATVSRNLGKPMLTLPNVDVQLPLGTVEFHLHEEDVKALITIVLSTTRVAQVLSPSQSSPPDVKKEQPRPHSNVVPGSRPPTLARMDSVVEVTEVRVQASLHSISLDFETKRGPLFKALTSEVSAHVGVYKEMMKVKASVGSLGVTDMTSGGGQRKVVSLAEDADKVAKDAVKVAKDTDKVSSVELKLDTRSTRGPLQPLGHVQIKIAQVRLMLMAPFVKQLLEFVQRLKGVNTELVTNATKLSKGGAQAITSKAWDEFFTVNVEAHAPVLLLPVSETSDQAFMIDLGSVAIRNTLHILEDEGAGLEDFDIKLDSFKASRVLLNMEEDYVVMAERVLFQPFHIQLNVGRNLCSAWYSKRPAISLDCQMGEFKLLVGQEDLTQLVDLGKNFGKTLSRVLDKGSGGAEVREAIMEGLTAQEEEEKEERREEEVVTEMVKVTSSLSLFELKLFKDEPPLFAGNPVSMVVPDSYALASMKLLQMDLSVCVQSNEDVELQASLRDVVLCDEQPDQQQKKTGTRVVQQYTCNPLKAHSGDLDTPLVKISYLLRDDQHIVILNTQNILVLSDIQFLSTLSNYFQAILGNKDEEIPSPESSIDSILSAGSLVPQEDQAVVRPIRKLPRLKVEASIHDVRVAIVEDVEDPQALTLRLKTAYFHLQLTEKNKQGSVNIVELSIAASSFFNLEQVNKWLLLPCSMQLTMMGPLDKPAMDINGTVEAISLTLSPSVIRLIIHAVTSLIPKKEVQKQPAPQDLWYKKRIEGQHFWFFKPVPLHKARTETLTDTTEKGETLSLGVESVEVILESEGSVRTRGYPVLACNISAVVQLFEWTGDLRMSAEVHCEASYYNEKLSVWEPLLEPLEDPKTGRLQAWLLAAEVKRSRPDKQLVGGEEEETTEANFSVSVSAQSPLQLTLTKTSLELLKSLAKAYSKEYERKLEISADVESLTGAPFTVINKLGGSVTVFVKPGHSLKLRERKDMVKLAMSESTDLWFVRERGRKSYASLLTRPGDEEHAVDLAIGSFQNLHGVVISNPGCFYFTLELKKSSAKPVLYGVVIDVAVTGMKKTVTIRSPLQFYNHLQMNVEIFSAPDMSRDNRSHMTIIPPDECYAVPIEKAQRNVFYVVPVRPGGLELDLEPMGPPIAWFERPGTKYVDSRCRLPGDTDPFHFIRVLYEEENYVIRKNLPTEDFAHHAFHLHPPLFFQNLLPFTISTGDIQSGCPMYLIEPGQFIHCHEITPDREPNITVSVTQPSGSSLMGKVKILKNPKKYTKFAASTDDSTVVMVSVLTEDFGYHKVSIFSPYWMLNKSGLDIDYLVDGKAIKHPYSKHLTLLSTDNPKNNIQISARTPQGKRTDWTLKFSLNAVGTSGNFPARLGQKSYIFGVEVHLSQFTLTKIVTISPYYMLVNETEALLSVAEAATPTDMIYLPPGELVPFWPLSDGNRMLVTTDTDETPAVFNYKKPDTVCLRLESELKAVCVDVQESESAIIASFAPYYPGCVPVQIINHFPDLTLKFRQDSKSALVHTLGPCETMYYTWDNPLDRRALRWGLAGARTRDPNLIYVDKDDQRTIHIQTDLDVTGSASSSLLSPGASHATPPPIPGMADSWLDVDETFSERLVTAEDSGSDTSSISSVSSRTTLASTTSSLTTTDGGRPTSRAYWKSFTDKIQRVVLFTPFIETIDRIKAVGSYSRPQVEVSLALRAVGLSLVDNLKKRELAYIAVTQSGVIWQVEKARRKWKTLSNAIIAILEEAHLKKELDVKMKNLSVNLQTMQMFSPVKGRLRRTHHDGVHVKFTMSERDYSVYAKVGYVQVDNQLPFSVYPQVLYPLPPPPTVASTTEPKPFVEASIILRKKDDQSNVQHFKYVHVLVQKMAVNADLGFLLALVAFLSSGQSTPQLEAEYVKSDIEDTRKSLKDTIVPAISKDLESSKSFFDVLHIAPIKIVLSFTVRSVGKNKAGENTVGDRILELFLHSLGAILTSVQDTEMKFSLFHMEYQMKTGRALTRRLIKHYRTQALVELYTLVLGLDVLGNPVNVVKGVVGGTIDLFYEPIKGSVMGPEEFLEGLGIGLRSFVGGTVGGLTGAGAKITGAVGDVFAKLTFDENFQDKRQQQKTRQSKLGSKFGGFAKNVFEGVTGVVAQPVKGAQKEGAAGLFKGVGKGLVGLIVRPTGGLIDLTSGTLDFVTRKTQVGNIEITDIRPPRFIGRDGVVRPFSPSKAIGTALLHAVDEGKYVDQFYYGHIQLSKKLTVLVLDRSVMLIEKQALRDVLGYGGWHSQSCVQFRHLRSPAASTRDTNVIFNYKPGQEKSLSHISVNSEQTAREVAGVVNQSYSIFQKEF